MTRWFFVSFNLLLFHICCTFVVSFNEALTAVSVMAFSVSYLEDLNRLYCLSVCLDVV